MREPNWIDGLLAFAVSVAIALAAAYYLWAPW